MAEFKISRFRYTWKGNWSASTAYIRDDVVRYGGSSYVCVIQHTSVNNFYNDLYYTPPGETAQTPKWVKMTDGFAWRNTWSTSTAYNLGDVVQQGGVLYLCTTAHTSTAVFDNDLSNWTVYASLYNYRNAWVGNTRYSIGDTVQYGASVYRCITGHVSNSNFLEINSVNWELVYENIAYRGDWINTAGTFYKENDLVKFGGSIWRCREYHSPSDDSVLDFDAEEHWDIEIPGQQLAGEWQTSLDYKIGDIVRHGGYLFYSLTNNYNSHPSESIYQIEDRQDPVDWEIISKGINFRGTWATNQSYKTGDLVRRGGNLYVALLDVVADGSSLDYLDSSNWELVTVGQNFRGYWNENLTYSVNDIVVYLGSSYSCNIEHLSNQENFPGDNGSGFFFWDILLLVSDNNGMSDRGDLLTYDLSRTPQGDGSTFGPTRIDLGLEGQLVSVNVESSIIYKSYGQISRVVYVSTEGVDDSTNPLRGYSPFYPWRTVRFACEQVDDGFTGTTTVRVSAGLYEEITPIIIPSKTVVLGTELRSTTIKPAGPIAALALDSTYTIAVLTRISGIIEAIIASTPINPPKSTGNTLDQVLSLAETDSQAATDIQDLIDDIISYINFYVNSLGSNVAVTGTNTAVTAEGYLNAVSVLEANKEFLAAEAVAYMQTTFPEYSFDSELCKRDVRRYIDAWKYDIIYTGNYKSLLAARYYRNAVLGSLTEDMFYCRDATGVRNCTLSGMSGSLNPPNVFDLYQRPTGGAYISLDPGWGPNDDRTWITTRSPYIQGVTTIGDRCVGQKIDGSLHNGGNKSIVSNDFTQVLSDGVGAWVTDNGRAELVSVFTYYCTIGYLADRGGIIRATNGNCSYGNYGAIADGVDPSEVPKTASVYNRDNQAIVESAFSGDFTDTIQIFEWRHCGQNYTQASASIIGAGVGASVLFDDFRDDAVFEARLTDTSTTQVQRVGGSGYTLARNNAQVHQTPGGDLTSITIAATDSAEEAEYLGLRLIITSGSGTGQYGYITAYNIGSKVVSISKESDGQPGWDHVVPGYPVGVQLDQTTRYSIEPRPEFSDPGFAVEQHTAPSSTDWISAVYGETIQTFTGVAGGAGTGTVIEDDGLEPITATFDVIKNGRTYSVSINNAGAGYEAGQTLTILGTAIGGTTPENDCTIEVLTVSDDSTNSILTISSSGVGKSGNFVMLSQASSAGIYSGDGETWVSFNMPSSGDWVSMAAGNNRFVAIRGNSSVAASSGNGYTWTSRTLPASRDWRAVAYGGGVFLAVSGNLNAGAYSIDNGVTWTTTTLPTAGDSTINEWVDIAYGKNKFVVLANSNNIVAEGTYDSSSDTWTWDSYIIDVIADSSQKDWTSIAYGNNRFVAVSSTGEVSYSFDGAEWYAATMPTQDGSTRHYWRKLRYGQGVFFAVGDTGSRDVGADITAGPSNFSATSSDGLVWTSRTMASTLEWRDIAFGNPYIDVLDSSVGKNSPMWVASGLGTDSVDKIRTGVRARGRLAVSAGIIDLVKIWDPGSGYLEEPTLTVIDPNNTTDAGFENRLADGVLTNPTWLNRGPGYRTASTRVTVTGDGFADIIPTGKFIKITDLEVLPGPGAQIIFSDNEQRYVVVTIAENTNIAQGLSATIRISPEIRTRDRLEHGTSMSILERYSQCRITGHDFLDIGTGNFLQTNYPELYSTGIYVPRPENEVYEEDGGRVFYTSTDQSGNFRAGELFAVEQATGIVTISADFFQLDGLTELRLGGIRVGGSGVVIREFSTDPLFTEDSNNIVPTQKAIAAFLANRLSLGGSEIATSSFIAGQVLVGPDRITNAFSLKVVIPVIAQFEGEDSGIRGSIMAQTMFFRSFGQD